VKPPYRFVYCIKGPSGLKKDYFFFHERVLRGFPVRRIVLGQGKFSPGFFPQEPGLPFKKCVKLTLEVKALSLFLNWLNL